jgi:hypothetical protein
MVVVQKHLNDKMCFIVGWRAREQQCLCPFSQARIYGITAGLQIMHWILEASDKELARRHTPNYNAVLLVMH